MTVRIVAFHPDTEELRTPSIEELPQLLTDERHVIWVDMSGQEKEHEHVLADIFGFHPLLVEDALRDAPHPKIEEYGDYVYWIVRGLSPHAEEPTNLEMIELDLFLGKNYLVTHHVGDLRSVLHTREEIERQPRLLKRGAPMLAHMLLDKVVDLYLPLMQKFDEQIDALEQAIMEAPEPRQLQTIFSLKNSLQRIRRLGIHQRDVLEHLSSGECPLIPEKAIPFYRDVTDHFVRVTDRADSYRELVSSALTAYQSQQSARLNQVMKVLTMMSTIMLPLTFIAGVYGMNFDPDSSPWNMPELRWFYGYPAALLLMAVTTLALIWFFKRRGWL